MRHRLSLLVTIAPLLGFAMGCGGGQRTCTQAGSCGDKSACVVSTCRPAGSAPVPVSARRVVLEPVQVAVVTSRGGERADPTEIPFGRDAEGDVVLLLRFAAPFGADSQIEAAYLVLEPVDDAMPGASPVPISLTRILAPWSAVEASWATLPRLSSIESTWTASTWGDRPLRIDVTPQVRRWREHRSDDHGLALLASPQGPFGARYAAGLGRGQGPKIDVYLR